MAYILTSDNIKIEYSSRGEGTPIIFIHGFGGEGSSFRVIDKILSKSFNTIEVDLRGHGRSDTSSEISIDVFASDLNELIEKLDIKKPVLAGWSMGGAVVMEYIKQFGQKDISALVLIETSPMVMEEKGWKGTLLRGEYTKEQFIRDIKIMELDWMSFAESFVREMSPKLDENSLKLAIERVSGNRPEVMSSVWESLMSKDYRSILPSIELPTMVINGSDSTFYDPDSGKDIASILGNGEYKIIKDAGHLVVMEKPAELSRLISEFINNKIHIS
jgi:pimeloyl-ACP methyl ester carboxylesterase